MRRHYFSLLSAGVLGGVLALALTSSSFQLEQRATATGHVVAAQQPPQTAIPTAALATRPKQAPRARLVVYYVIDAEDQRRGIEAAVQADLSLQGSQNTTTLRDTFRDFIWARTNEEEAFARDFLNELAVIAQLQDYQFQVVDLR